MTVMPRAPKPKSPPRPGRPRSGRPRIADRNTERVQLSMLPAERAGLDAIAAEWTEPGMPPNRSAAWRRIWREWTEWREERRGGV
jgi:hypothetical protein